MGDFDGNGHDDLAVGVPGERDARGTFAAGPSRPGSGMASILYGNLTLASVAEEGGYDPRGLGAEQNQIWSQGR